VKDGLRQVRARLLEEKVDHFLAPDARALVQILDIHHVLPGHVTRAQESHEEGPAGRRPGLGGRPPLAELRSIVANARAQETGVDLAHVAPLDARGASFGR